MRITNLNPREDIGASAWHLELEGHGLLMDAGVHPKHAGQAGLPKYELIRDKQVDSIAITHCHHDHVGSLPVAIRQFPDAHVMMSELSYFIVERVLHNSVNVMKRQRDELGIKEYPFYTHRELDEIAYLFQGYKYEREIEWASPKNSTPGTASPTLEFRDAGHALGSAGLMVRGEHETVFYSGDVCFGDQTLLKGARFEDIKADVLILETTRGNREIPEGFTRQKEIERLASEIEKVIKRRGSVLIPTFALGRTQEILALLALMMREGKLRDQPIYIGGLGRVFTEIYDLEAHRASRNHSNLNLNESLNLIVLDKKLLESMKMKGSRLFVLTAGMMTEHTPAHELALRMAEDEKQGIFFVGYADPDTPAGRLRAAEQGETFHFSQSGGQLTRKCDLQEFDLTAHANRGELLDFVGQVSPHTVILGHGDPESRNWFEQQIRQRHPKMKVLQPGSGETAEA
jgi:Cft2 family RNA processing exonuclease